MPCHRVKGEKVVTDVTANDGSWHFICLAWDSYTGTESCNHNEIVLEEMSSLTALTWHIKNDIDIILDQQNNRKKVSHDIINNFRHLIRIYLKIQLRLSNINIYFRIFSNNFQEVGWCTRTVYCMTQGRGWLKEDPLMVSINIPIQWIIDEYT